MPLTNKTIVLDLDSTLIRTCDEEENEIFNNLELYTNHRNAKLRSRIYYFEVVDVCDTSTSPVGSGQLTKMWGILRPHVYEFLDFCFEYFETVIVWSAGQKRYVHAICDFLFNKIGKQPAIIYTFEDCIIGQNFIHKPLSKISHIPIENIMALDDNESTFSKNKDNGLHIPAYEPGYSFEEIMEKEDSLYYFMEWLKSSEVFYGTDVRKMDKTYCFSQDPTLDPRKIVLQKNLEETEDEENELKSLAPKDDN